MIKFITFYFVTTSLLLSSNCFSQNRVNDPLPVILKSIGQIQTAQGWLKNSSGEWISRKNKIISDLGSSTKTLENFEKYSIGEDNFISFERKEIIIKGDTCTLLLKKYRDGYYKYESIEKGWVPQNSCRYYVISINETARIESIEHNKLNNLHLEILYSGDLKYLDLKTLTNNQIAKEINKEINQNSSSNIYKLGLNITCYDDKKLVQFYFYDYLSGLGNEENNKYYETTYDVFNNFINIL